MRVRTLARAAAAALVAALLGGCAAQGGDTAKTTYRVIVGLAAQNLAWSAGEVPWMERITELTDGRVEFETFAGGELVELENETYALETGVVDIAMVLPIYEPDQYPLTEVTMLPLSESDVHIGSEAFKRLIESDEKLYDGKTYTEWQFGSKGLKAFGMHTTPEYAISTTGAAPHSLRELEALQLRSAARVHNIYADHIGAGTISIPNAETFDALSRGAFDGAFSSVADWANYGLEGLYTYSLTGIYFGHFNLMTLMTEETWNEMDPELQGIMQQALDETYEGAAQAWYDRGEEVSAAFVDAGGQFEDISELPPDVQERLEAGVEATWTDWIEMLDAQGLPGTEAALHWRDIVVDVGGEVPAGIAEMEAP